VEARALRRLRQQEILPRCAGHHNRQVTKITAPGVITLYHKNGIRKAASRTERVAPLQHQQLGETKWHT
jgi:hypothetical protein